MTGKGGRHDAGEMQALFLDCNDWRSIDGLRRVKLADDDVGALRKLRGEQTVETL